ncbi:hypothetical protein AJ79_09260 [Helicocarpus griseus UAMH5409]|uniref:Protein kinase domain-containing protein n=1 Tax=Helicocarpus griseus UAMH5409 TaxID=1447875 RepID=A0A2B7WKV4_9EURO|nr:hypothetical protein AJ79_09260 [Helicocarpus griseus UAMH5409]
MIVLIEGGWQNGPPEAPPAIHHDPDPRIERFVSELPMDDPQRKSTSKPQLRRFVHHDKPIKFHRILGFGTEGNIYHVEIEGNSYALKLFEHWATRGLENPKLTKDEQLMTAPFIHECRSFARLDSIGQNGTWAVRCHGLMMLDDEQFKSLGSDHRIFSRWAIVKGFIRDELAVSDIREIRRKMQIARKALLWPKDIKPENYRGSFLVDLGSTRTYPYIHRFWSNTSRREWFAYWEERGAD